MLTIEQFRNKYGHFTWFFGALWTIEVDGTVYIWSDPDYQGDNTIYRYAKPVSTAEDYKEMVNVVFGHGTYGRDKGYRFIGDRLNADVKWKG